MPNKFHINSNGDVKPCAATKNACQFGDGSLHFETAAEGRRAVEAILEQSPDGSTLRGKKSSLTDVLLKSIRAQDKKKSVIPSAPQKSKNERVEALTKELSQYGYYPVDKAPSPVLNSLRAAIPGGSLTRAFKNRSGDFKALGFDKDGKLFTLTAPPTKDIPFPNKNWETWNMSFHPRGPKVSYACAGCGRPGDARVADFSRRQGDFRIRCSSCGQLNTLNIVIE